MPISPSDPGDNIYTRLIYVPSTPDYNTYTIRVVFVLVVSAPDSFFPPNVNIPCDSVNIITTSWYYECQYHHYCVGINQGLIYYFWKSTNTTLALNIIIRADSTNINLHYNVILENSDITTRPWQRLAINDNLNLLSTYVIWNILCGPINKQYLLHNTG
jgi:hypothetical protein